MLLRKHCFKFLKFLIVAFTLACPCWALAQAETGERSTATVGAVPLGEGVKTQATSAAPADNTTVSAPAAVPEAPQETLPPNVQEARRRFDRGIRLYGEGDFGLALIEFERAYELVANYRVLYNIGQVSIQLRRYAKAREALEQYLTQGGAEVEGARLEEVQADIDMLKPRTAKLLVTTNAPRAKVSLDGNTWGTLPLANALLVDAGNHVVKVEASGYQVSEKPVVLAGGDEVTVAVTLEVNTGSRTPGSHRRETDDRRSRRRKRRQHLEMGRLGRNRRACSGSRDYGYLWSEFSCEVGRSDQHRRCQPRRIGL
jgi:hypothetical protein